jgi:hypothetical protein
MWWCPECGRIAGDRYGVLATRQGWSDDCTRQAVLVLASTMMVEADGRVREADLLNDQLPPMTSDTGLPH